MDLSPIQQVPPSEENEGFMVKQSPLEFCYEKTDNLTSFDDLPISILCVIFSKTTPQDVSRLAVVSRQCEEAARADQVWSTFLPPNARDIARNAHEGALAYQSARDLYHQLTNHVLLADGTQGYWLDRKTGASCWSFSVVALSTIWNHRSQYWTYVAKAGSRFSTVAEQAHPWWLDMAGAINVKLPPGEYTIAWVLLVEDEDCEWDHFDVTCSFTENGGPERAMQIKLLSCMGWTAYHFGHFTVISDLGDEESLEEVNLKVFLDNHDYIIGKTGLWLDGINICSGKLDI